jgi:hypothetical protein
LDASDGGDSSDVTGDALRWKKESVWNYKR